MWSGEGREGERLHPPLVFFGIHISMLVQDTSDDASTALPAKSQYASTPSPLAAGFSCLWWWVVQEHLIQASLLKYIHIVTG